MNKSKKSFALITLLTVSAASLLSSCRKTPTVPDGEEIDETKTQLTVGTFDGGFGKEWLNEAIDRFEAKYADVSFEEGKKGAQILVYGNKSSYTGATLANSALDKDIYFTEMVDVISFMNNGKIADITDIVTESLSEMTDGEETGTIEDKLDPAFKSYFTQKDGKYYALPFYDGVYGIICDVDYFSKNKWLFDDEGDIGASLQFAGPGLDGIKGTFDDGLPTTYEEWSVLCSYIRRAGVVPFCYYGADAEGYVNEACKSIWTTVEGKEKFTTSLSFDGTLDLVKPDTINIVPEKDDEGIAYKVGTYETEQVAITNANLNQAQRTPGKLEMFRFIDEVICESGNYKKNKSTFLDMQQNFIETPEYSDNSKTKYAMTFDGAWWQNEAKDVFDTLKSQGRKGANERKFVFMPVPTQNGIKDQVIMSANESFAFINKNATHLDLAKLFFQYLHTDKELQFFTKSTATSRALNYTIPESWLNSNELSYFTKSMINLKNTAEFVYPYSSNPIVARNYGAFDFRGEWPFSSKISGTNTKSPFVFLRDNQEYNAKDYFKGSLSYFDQNWLDSLS